MSRLAALLASAALVLAPVVATAQTIVPAPTLSNGTSTGTGAEVLQTSPTLITPVLGVATGTSLALGGCTISTNAICWTGTASGSGALNLSGGFKVSTSADANALVVDNATGQVSCGSGPVQTFRKLYCLSVDIDPTVDGEIVGHDVIEAREDYKPTADTAANPDGIYGTLWYDSAHTFSGDGAAVRGNAYTIAQQGGAPVNVVFLIGLYGRARQEALGTVSNAVGVFADAFQQGLSPGVATNSMGLFVIPSTLATNNYGAYFTTEPNGGSLAAAINTNLRYSTSGTGYHRWFTAGGEYMTLTADGRLGINTLAPCGSCRLHTTAGIVEQDNTTANQHLVINSTVVSDENGIKITNGSGTVYVVNNGGNFATDFGAGAKFSVTPTGAVTAAAGVSVGGPITFTGTIPTVTGTGSPTIAAGSTDTSGEVTGGTSATSIVITFATSKTNAPFCTVSPQTSVASFVYSISTTAITITETAQTGQKVDYHCTQH